MAWASRWPISPTSASRRARSPGLGRRDWRRLRIESTRGSRSASTHGWSAQLEALVREHPSRERLVGQLMVALYRSGRQADALESYRVARRRLVDELGLEPGRELQELERAILAQDPALDAPARATARKLSATARPPRRGGLVIAAGAAVLLAVLIAAAVRLAGSGTSSTVRVAPNSLAAIDTDTNRVVGQVAVGTRPGAIAFGSGSLWVANLDDQTISRVDPKTLRPAARDHRRRPSDRDRRRRRRGMGRGFQRDRDLRLGPPHRSAV